MCDVMIKDIGRRWSGICRLLRSRDWPPRRYTCDIMKVFTQRHIVEMIINQYINELIDFDSPEMSCDHLVIRRFQNLLTFVLWAHQLKHTQRGEAVS